LYLNNNNDEWSTEEREREKNGRLDQVCFVEYTRQTNVFNLVKERIYFMSVAGGHSTKKQQEKLFIHIEQHTRTEREDDRKKRLDIHTHTGLFIQWIKCRHRWFGVENRLFIQVFFCLSFLLLI
jgi:hypothetical protein